MRFRDVRKFGTLHLLDDPATTLFKDIGPEPLDASFTDEILKARLLGRSTRIKPLLLDQSFVAGCEAFVCFEFLSLQLVYILSCCFSVGNIYADEALHRARLHPEKLASSFTDDEIARLREAIVFVLTLGIEREGASIRDYQKADGTQGDMQNCVEAYGRTGEKSVNLVF